jgi:signal transduction histidine kinase
MDGLELVAAMKADQNLRQIPVILVTAKATREEVVRGLDIGADDYLSKPFGHAELCARVRAAERHSAIYEELAAKHRELSSAMRKLNETQADLVQTEKLAAFGTLIAGMSHELGNPVTAILMNAQSLLGRIPSEMDGRRSLEVIERQARRAGRLLKLLMDASHSKAITTAPVAVAELIARVAELAGIAQLRSKGVLLRLETVGSGLPMVDASVEEMEVALLHVIKNALEAATPNGQVWVRANRRDDQKTPGVEILVGDSGAGIAPDVLGQIFDPLFTTKPVGSGMGLGLTLARRIVESHHGWIRVESQVGVGTVVRIWLPASSAIAPLRNDA